jgi:serine protease
MATGVSIVLASVLAAAAVAIPSAAPATGTRACGRPRPERRSPAVGFPNDPLFSRQWNLRQIKAPEAWAAGATGKGAVIAVIDSGVDVRHPDLGGRIVLPPNVRCSWVGDGLGHGTHVAGVAAASVDNGRGIAGVAPDAKVMPFGPGTRPAQIRIAADSGADVINMSWTSIDASPVDPLHPDLVAALDYAWGKGVVLVAAAGNDLYPNCEYPAAHPKVLCVASTDSAGRPSHLSNLPNKIEGVTLRAPGGVGAGGCDATDDIWSTLPPTSTYGSCGAYPGYEPLGGTSMAAPHVAGVAAMLSGLGYDRDEIVECIISTAVNPLTGARGAQDPVYGYGVLDAEAAVKACREG